jgi:hypothetical protein
MPGRAVCSARGPGGRWTPWHAKRAPAASGGANEVGHESTAERARLGCRVGWRRLRLGVGHARNRPARSLHPERGGSVGGSRREDCSQSGSGCRAQPEGWSSLGRPRRARPGYCLASARTWAISSVRRSSSESWSRSLATARRITSLADRGSSSRRAWAARRLSHRHCSSVSGGGRRHAAAEPVPASAAAQDRAAGDALPDLGRGGSPGGYDRAALPAADPARRLRRPVHRGDGGAAPRPGGPGGRDGAGDRGHHRAPGHAACRAAQDPRRTPHGRAPTLRR